MPVLRISETFHSIKGEGLYYGAPMFFVRFAGCNVGRVGFKNMPVRSSKNPLSIVEGTTCTTYDGRQFGCDTDYAKYEQLDLDDSEAVEKFFSQVWEKRLVLTGGEPLFQLEAFQRMIQECQIRRITPHVETSGTILLHIPEEQAWIACSPKAGYKEEMLLRANEIKLLVGKDFNFDTVPKVCFDHPLVFVCPINDGATDSYFGKHDQANLDRCMQLIREVPSWRVGVQLHKLLGVR